ncbi:hypothetical protein PR048_011596, partial [Dryococelus australis]
MCEEIQPINGKICMITWYDKKPFMVLSANYSFYRMKARTNKWTVHVLLHLFNVSVTNAWLQHRSDCHYQKKRPGEIMRSLEFRMKLTEELVQCPTADGDEAVNDYAPEYIPA